MTHTVLSSKMNMFKVLVICRRIQENAKTFIINLCNNTLLSDYMKCWCGYVFFVHKMGIDIKLSHGSSADLEGFWCEFGSRAHEWMINIYWVFSVWYSKSCCSHIWIAFMSQMDGIYIIFKILALKHLGISCINEWVIWFRFDMILIRENFKKFYHNFFIIWTFCILWYHLELCLAIKYILLL